MPEWNETSRYTCLGDVRLMCKLNAHKHKIVTSWGIFLLILFQKYEHSTEQKWASTETDYSLFTYTKNEWTELLCSACLRDKTRNHDSYRNCRSQIWLECSCNMLFVLLCLDCFPIWHWRWLLHPVYRCRHVLGTVYASRQRYSQHSRKIQWCSHPRLTISHQGRQRGRWPSSSPRTWKWAGWREDRWLSCGSWNVYLLHSSHLSIISQAAIIFMQ